MIREKIVSVVVRVRYRVLVGKMFGVFTVRQVVTGGTIVVTANGLLVYVLSVVFVSPCFAYTRFRKLGQEHSKTSYVATI